jgi:hypothetical protein
MSRRYPPAAEVLRRPGGKIVCGLVFVRYEEGEVAPSGADEKLGRAALPGEFATPAQGSLLGSR